MLHLLRNQPQGLHGFVVGLPFDSANRACWEIDADKTDSTFYMGVLVSFTANVGAPGTPGLATAIVGRFDSCRSQ